MRSNTLPTLDDPDIERKIADFLHWRLVTPGAETDTSPTSLHFNRLLLERRVTALESWGCSVTVLR
jgi:hypothetical protein